MNIKAMTERIKFRLPLYKTFFVYHRIIIILLAASITVFPQKHDFSKIDRAVLQLKRAKTMKSVIKCITRHSKNDWDRTRGAYIWIANN